MAENTCSLDSTCTNIQLQIVSFFSNRNIAADNLKVIKRSRDLIDGDLCLPCGKVIKQLTEVLDDLKIEIQEQSRTWYMPISCVQMKTFNALAFYIERPIAFKNILKKLWHEDFIPKEQRNCCVLINNSELCVHRNEDHHVCLEVLRSVVVMQHLSRILQAQSYDVQFVKYPVCYDMESILKTMNFLIKDVKKESPSADSQGILREVSHSKFNLKRTQIDHVDPVYICSMDKMSMNEIDTDESCHSSVKETHQNKMSSVVLNLQHYMADNQLSTGKGRFDKHLQNVVVVDENGPTDVLQQVFHVNHSCQQLKKDAVLLHISSDKRCFSQQKVNLVLQMSQPNVPPQVHVILGQVQSRKSDHTLPPCALDFIKLRYSQIKQASVMKYGDEVHGSGWEDTLNQLTSACIKFELLHNVCKTNVKLDFSSCDDFGGGVDNRTGAFIMYNCARLSTLFKHFDEAVAKGKYPCLPAIDEVDFSTLREEEEWVLLFNYVVIYQDLLKDLLQEMVPQSGELFPKVHTHKICHFLTSLSRTLSCYYSRRHVLGENRSQLLPTMYARLYLLKVIFKILQHALHLMDITLLSQL